MASATDIVWRYHADIQKKRKQLTLMLGSARELASQWYDDWPNDGFAHHAAPDLAFTCLTGIDEEDVVLLASDGSLWSGWNFDDGRPEYLERIEIDIYEPAVENDIKKLADLIGRHRVR